MWNVAYNLECAGRENDMEVATVHFKELKNVFEKVVTFISQPDWIEIAKHESIVTKEKFNPNNT